MQWFDIDTKGLAQLVQGRGKELICNELIANAWDADEVSEVRLQAERIGTSPYVRITVEDDSPAGFARLKDAFTVFAPSQRKGDAGKRGRFNVGEKLTIAMCRCAEICTTTGTVTFDEGGRRERRNGRPAGSRFTGEVRLNQAELQELLDHARSLISPAGIRTFINDQPIADLTHDEIYKTHPKGHIGLQVHGIAAGTGPYKVWWRNLRIRELAK